MTFNPFGKSVGESLTTDDLQLLIEREVAEGYLVEYKSRLPSDNTKIAHSVASFANTQGGWYIVGVEADKKTNVATRIAGIDLSIERDPIARVRDVTFSQIKPPPRIFPQLLMLDDGRAVLVVYVPESEDTPHITQDGRVYRRAADKTEPVYENDRLTLDRLYEKARESRRRFDDFCHDDRTFSKGEAGSWLEVYFQPYPMGRYGDLYHLADYDLQRILALASGALDIRIGTDASISLSPVTGTGVSVQGQIGFASITIRLLDPARLAFNSQELVIHADGRCSLFVPIAFRKVWDPNDNNSLSVRACLTKLGLQSNADLYDDNLHLRFIDLRETWGRLLWSLAVYFNWLNAAKLDGDMWMRLRLSGMWRCVPFADVDAWAEYVETHGLPVSHRDTIEVPGWGRRPVEVSVQDGVTPMAIIALMGLALGVPDDALLNWQS